jgi:hypothetical protein
MNQTEELFEKIRLIPAVDIHTHIDASHLSARGLHDVLLYHMVISELYSAGCPDGARLPENVGDEEAERRILRALPYVRHIQGTSCYWGVRMILKDLYGWDRDITQDNWREIDGIIRAKSKDPAWPREIMKMAGIEKSNTELCKRNGGAADDIFFYNLEWAFFTRCQYKQYDTALLELEAAWSEAGVGSPLPVNIDPEKLKITKRIKTLDDVDEALDYYISKIPFNEIHGLPSHYSTDILYRNVGKKEMAAAIKKRAKAGPEERDVYANYVFDVFLSKMNALEKRAPLPFSIGAEPLQYETGSKLSGETLYSLADTAHKYQNIDFILFSSCEHQDQALCSLIRETPNLYAAGYWWHSFFPESIARIISRRLDMLPANKWFGFFSDAYCMDWAYAKSIIVRRQFAQELSQKMAQGRYDEKLALDMAKKLLHDTAVEYFKL